MKIFKSALVLFIMCLSMSCSSDDDTNDTTTPMSDDGQLVATVDNSTFTSGTTETAAEIISGTLNLTAENSNGDKIAIYINNFDSAGTYDMSGSTAEATGLYIPSGDVQFFNSLNAGGSGSLIITDYDEANGSISGTFNFIAVRQSSNDSGESTPETVEITNGSFTDVALN